MKRILLFIFITCFSFAAKAQQDSILVVIECDSVYRPFLMKGLSYYITPIIDEQSSGTIYQKKVDSTLTFYISKKLQNDSIKINLSCDIYFNTFRYKRSTKNKIIIIKYPYNCEGNKYLIDNTCPKCSQKEDVSWIWYGLPMELPNGTFQMTAPNLPYNTPIAGLHPGGCSYEFCFNHWHCNMCKTEY